MNPTRSQNSTVTTLRSSPWTSPWSSSDAEQNPQQANPSGLSLPQAGQVITSASVGGLLREAPGRTLRPAIRNSMLRARTLGRRNLGVGAADSGRAVQLQSDRGWNQRGAARRRLTARDDRRDLSDG